jgi:non-ribosomal peptide synthetase component E (peptide arylation enzyme)
MITNRIYQWARSHPNWAAITGNDHTLSYRDFVHAIGSAYRFFDQQGLQATQTAIVLPGVLIDALVFVMALRMLALDTVCVQSVEEANTIHL